MMGGTRLLYNAQQVCGQNRLRTGGNGANLAAVFVPHCLHMPGLGIAMARATGHARAGRQCGRVLWHAE